MAKKKSAFDRVPQRLPNIDQLNTHALTLLQQRQFQAGADLLSQSLALDPRQTEAHYNLGYALQHLGLLDSAIAAFGKTIALSPNDCEALMARGHVLAIQKRFEEAALDFSKVVKLTPQNADAWNNYGNVLLELLRETEAIEAYEQALALRPTYAQGWFNKGKALHELERYAESGKAYERACQIDPDYAEARWHLSWIRLLQGDFDQGWRDFEARWDVPALGYRRKTTVAPLWLGEQSLSGKTILLHAEQGLGDTLQFCRYVPLLIEQGARVLLEVPEVLTRLMISLHPSLEVFRMGEVSASYDFHCPLMSLPLACATRLATIPDRVPYLSVAPMDVEKWAAALAASQGGRLRVGLAWSGSAGHKNDANRSMTLETLTPLFESANVDFVALQPELRHVDELFLNTHPNVKLQRYALADFADTAALIKNLDLVISVDTSVAHLAGALGKPVWILLSTGPDYRWMLERTDSPWYPTARLFRQPKRSDWDAVVTAVARAIKAGLVVKR